MAGDRQPTLGLAGDLGCACSGPLCLPALQRLAYHRAVAKRLDPNRLQNLTAVVEL
jgi:hypothetical protein